jgi:hypothetical protein
MKKMFTRIGLASAALVGTMSTVGAQTVPPEFQWKVLATGISQPKGLDAAHYQAGAGSMGRKLFVAESGQNRVVEVDRATGIWAPMASTGSFPVGVACYGGPFAQYMYVGNAFSGGIEKVASDGTTTQFALAGMSIAGLDFSKGIFGQYLYAGQWAAGNIWRVDSQGNATLFASAPGTETRYLTFSKGGPFGAYLYYTDFVQGNVHRVAPDGTVTLFATLRSPGIEGLTFGPGGIFGKDLYVGNLSTGEIFRIAEDGTWVVWASGFPGVADILFQPGGRGGFTMYLVDGQASGKVYSVGAVRSRKML